MISPILTLLGYSIIPVAAATFGGVVTLWRRPGEKLQSLFQHLTAGVVFAAAAGELLPDMLRAQDNIAGIVIGGLLGIVAMLGLKTLSGRIGAATGLVALIGFDVLIDGLVVGLGFIAGADQGLLLVIALSAELLFLGLGVAVSLGHGQTSSVRIVWTTIGIALLMPVGALIGYLVFSQVSEDLLAGFFAFGLVALLYLVTEELLKEAHETADTPLATASFFIGFFVLIILDELIR